METRMFRKVKQGKTVLFLGAGASSSAGAPAGNELATMIRDEFLPENKSEKIDFIDTLSEVLDTPGIDRKTLEDFIKLKLSVQPSRAHIDMCRIRWQSIFTTNYDDLIETAYRIAPKKAQDRCDPIFDNRFSRTESDYFEAVRLFKLMGSVTGSERSTRMALSRSDYNRKIQQRQGLLKLLKDMAKDGTIIYIGYSFSDLIVRDILDEIREEIPIDEMPWSWALLPEWDSRTEQMLRERRILPLRMTFDEFINHSVSILDEKDFAQEPTVSLTISDVSIQIPKADLSMYKREFEFCNDDMVTQTIPDRSQAVREFLEGQSNPWIGITNNWAFKRNCYNKIINEVQNHIDKILERECPTILVLGPAGSGKSIIAKMVAYQIYTTKGLPCILLDPATEKVDFKVIDSFFRFVNESVENKKSLERRLPILIFIDEAAARMQEVRRLPQYLISRGITSILVAFARENEWKQAEGDYHTIVDETILIPDQFEGDEETEALIGHLRSLHFLESAQDNQYWVNQVKTQYENSFWNTLYHIAYPTRPPLTQCIRNEYDQLNPIAKIAYRYICVFYQYSVPIDLELLARSIHRSYEEFTKSVYDPASLGVIIEDPEALGIRYRARTRMVAELVCKYVYTNTEEWLNEIRLIVSNLLPNNTSEIETVRNLLIRHLGPNGTHRISPPDLLIPVFEAAFNAGMRDSATLHHCALLLLNKEDFLGAESYLNQAIDVLNNTFELTHFKTESRQMLENSLATVAARKALHFQKNGKLAQAVIEFQRATNLFHRARTGEFANAYPFYGEAWMFLRRSETAGNDRVSLLAQALQVIDQSEGNVDDEGQSSLAEIESKIVEALSSIPKLREIISTMIAEGDANGSYLNARSRSRVYTPDGTKMNYSVQEAYTIVIEALGFNPNHLPCLRLACRLHRRVYPNDWKGWWELLNRRIRLEEIPAPNSLLFDLGYAACQLGKYNDASRYFEQLEHQSSGLPRRASIVSVVKDDNQDRRFAGEILPGLTRNEGWIRCEIIGQHIRFLPLRQRFTSEVGQKVTFVLALNYRGYFAMELRRA
jgi:tetratricopeptide (TPR) repeat protein